MNPEETAFVTYSRRKGRYTEELGFEDIKLEETDSNIHPTWIHYDRGKGTWEYEYRLAFHSLVGALNDLAKGKEEVLQAINRLANKGRTVYRFHQEIEDPPVAMGNMHTLICRTLLTYTTNLPNLLCLNLWKISLHD